jgi:hypothetical protein
LNLSTQLLVTDVGDRRTAYGVGGRLSQIALELGSPAAIRRALAPCSRQNLAPIAHLLVFLSNINTLNQIELNIIRSSVPIIQ